MASALDGLTDSRRDGAPQSGSALAGLTDAQRDAVTHRGSPLLVIGGPGTGKTEVLVRRLVWLADGLAGRLRPAAARRPRPRQPAGAARTD
ncbi:MAG: UvrD-helicase domain-containing protein [Solirubrobacteraceae bacterium]